MAEDGGTTVRMSIPVALGRLLDEKVAEVNQLRDLLAQRERELNDLLRELEPLVVGECGDDSDIRYHQPSRSFIVQPKRDGLG